MAYRAATESGGSSLSFLGWLWRRLRSRCRLRNSFRRRFVRECCSRVLGAGRPAAYVFGVYAVIVTAGEQVQVIVSLLAARQTFQIVVERYPWPGAVAERIFKPEAAKIRIGRIRPEKTNAGIIRRGRKTGHIRRQSRIGNNRDINNVG